MENMSDLLKFAMKYSAKFEVQYTDYEDNQWTVPVKLTESRIEGIVMDNSIKKIRLIID